MDDAGACACHHGWGGSACSGCAPSFRGDSCQFSDLETCNNHGNVDRVGKCDCNSNFAGAGCNVCVEGFKGASCEYSRDTTCHSHGKVSESGVCTCDVHFGGGIIGSTDKDTFCSECTPPWVGIKCMWSNQATCGGNGRVDSISGTCSCNDKWDGTHCEQCASGRAGIQSFCTFSDAIDCNGHGVVDSAGRCKCNQESKWKGVHCEECKDPWRGDQCQYSDLSNCLNHGHASARDGSCVCLHHWSGEKCDKCGDGYAGEDCQYSDVSDCKGHGVVKRDGSCACRNGWSGVSGGLGGSGVAHCGACPVGHAGGDCEFSDSKDCSGNGVVHFDARCTCRNDWHGSKCNVCPEGHAGDDCQYSDVVDCHGNGAVRGDGACECLENWFGSPHCDRCAVGRKGSRCQYDRKKTCFDHGELVGSIDFPSLCQCDKGYWGVHCRYQERAFMERCVAGSTRSPDRCCGEERYASMLVIEEERRITKEDLSYRQVSKMKSKCDSVWGVWRSSGYHVSRTGVPRIEEEDEEEEEKKGSGGGDDGGGEWVSKRSRAIMFDLMAKPRKNNEINNEVQDAPVAPAGYSKA